MTIAECIFCQILEGNAPATFIYRDGEVAAFMDVQPVNPGHLLVMPTRHAAYLADIDEGLAGRVMQVGHRLAAAIRGSGLRCEGVNLFLADGQAALQDVFHVHLHVIPRFVEDGFGLVLPPGYSSLPPRSALEEAAAKIRSRLVDLVP